MYHFLIHRCGNRPNGQRSGSISHSTVNMTIIRNSQFRDHTIHSAAFSVEVYMYIILTCGFCVASHISVLTLTTQVLVLLSKIVFALSNF